jgi:acetyl esterase/lipase
MTGWAVVDALGVAIAVVLLAWTSLLYAPFWWRPVGLHLFVPKQAAGAFTPFIAAAGGLLLALVGGLRGSRWMAVPAGLHRGGAPGPTACRPGRGPRPQLGRPHPRRTPRQDGGPPVARAAADHARATPAPGRRLRDGTGHRPQAAVRRVAAPSRRACFGLAVVYLHGSAWYVLDKDVGTRPLFRHLAAQGHVVVDVAYRLFPEADVPGMVADAKRAVAWVTRHTADLQVQPDRIVLAGGSAGGHLALLAAYAPEDPTLTPAELAGSDPSVCAVVSLYGQADLEAMYNHTGQQESDDRQPDWDAPPPAWVRRLLGPDAGRLHLQSMAATGRLDWLVGGTPARFPTATPSCHRSTASTRAAQPPCCRANTTRWRRLPPPGDCTGDWSRRACR